MENWLYFHSISQFTWVHVSSWERFSCVPLSPASNWVCVSSGRGYSHVLDSAPSEKTALIQTLKQTAMLTSPTIQFNQVQVTVIWNWWQFQLVGNGVTLKKEIKSLLLYRLCNKCAESLESTETKSFTLPPSPKHFYINMCWACQVHW